MSSKKDNYHQNIFMIFRVASVMKFREILKILSGMTNNFSSSEEDFYLTCTFFSGSDFGYYCRTGSKDRKIKVFNISDGKGCVVPNTLQWNLALKMTHN